MNWQNFMNMTCFIDLLPQFECHTYFNWVIDEICKAQVSVLEVISKYTQADENTRRSRVFLTSLCVF